MDPLQSLQYNPEKQVQPLAPSPSEPEISAKTVQGIYTVQAGDTQWTIADAFKMDVIALTEMNRELVGDNPAQPRRLRKDEEIPLVVPATRGADVPQWQVTDDAFLQSDAAFEAVPTQQITSSALNSIADSTIVESIGAFAQAVPRVLEESFQNGIRYVSEQLGRNAPETSVSTPWDSILRPSETNGGASKTYDTTTTNAYDDFVEDAARTARHESQPYSALQVQRPHSETLLRGTDALTYIIADSHLPQRQYGPHRIHMRWQVEDGADTEAFVQRLVADAGAYVNHQTTRDQELGENKDIRAFGAKLGALQDVHDVPRLLDDLASDDPESFIQTLAALRKAGANPAPYPLDVVYIFNDPSENRFKL